MIITFIIESILTFLAVVFSWLPDVETLPTVVGYDIDTALVTAVGQLRALFVSFWPLEILMQGFLVLMGYYMLKMLLRFVIGHRA